MIINIDPKKLTQNECKKSIESTKYFIIAAMQWQPMEALYSYSAVFYDYKTFIWLTISLERWRFKALSLVDNFLNYVASVFIYLCFQINNSQYNSHSLDYDRDAQSALFQPPEHLLKMITYHSANVE